MKLTPLIITVAGVGAELTKKQTPYLPADPFEVVQDILTVSSLGASIYHLHVRDEKGKPTCSPSLIKKIIRDVRKKSDIIIQVSTGGSVKDGLPERLGTLVPGVEMGSLTMGSVNFGNEVFLNPISIIHPLLQKMIRKKIKPEFEIFDVGFLEFALRIIEKEKIEFPHFNFMLGGKTWLGASEENLDFLLSKLPKKATWCGSGVGASQFFMAKESIQRGGHVRCGLEDNIFISKGVLAKGNGELVENVIEFAKKAHRPVATAQMARKILKLG